MLNWFELWLSWNGFSTVECQINDSTKHEWIVEILYFLRLSKDNTLGCPSKCTRWIDFFISGVSQVNVNLTCTMLHLQLLGWHIWYKSHQNYNIWFYAVLALNHWLTHWHNVNLFPGVKPPSNRPFILDRKLNSMLSNVCFELNQTITLFIKFYTM